MNWVRERPQQWDAAQRHIHPALTMIGRWKTACRGRQCGMKMPSTHDRGMVDRVPSPIDIPVIGFGVRGHSRLVIERSMTDLPPGRSISRLAGRIAPD
jgi:hypothetical protein